MLRKLAIVPIAVAVAAVPGLLPGTPAMAQDYAIIGLSLFDDLVPTGGAEGADADFNAEFDFVEGRICYYLEINGLPDADGAASSKAGQGPRWSPCRCPIRLMTRSALMPTPACCSACRTGARITT